MASKQQAKAVDAVPKLALGLDAVRGFVPLVIDGERTSFARLVKGVGSKDQYHPRRSIQKYLDALEIFQLADIKDDGVLLLPAGKRFRSSLPHGTIVIRNAFVSAPIPSAVLQALAQTITLSKKEVKMRLAAIDRAAESESWLEWLQFAGFITVSDSEATMQESIMDPRALYSAAELARLREVIYRRISMISDGDITATGNCFHRSLDDLLAEFRAAKADDAELPMMRFVEAALFRLGFDVQVANGSRDSGDKLHFGPKGEDVVAFFLNPPAAASDGFNGLVLAAELKRTSSDKKAVTQALAARSRVTAYFSSNVAAFALTISDTETYADKVARDYANITNVPHVSIDGLMGLCKEQDRRYRKATANLITPVDLWHVLNAYRNQNYIEPQAHDLADAVKASADK